MERRMAIVGVGRQTIVWRRSIVRRWGGEHSMEGGEHSMEEGDTDTWEAGAGRVGQVGHPLQEQ